MNISLLFCITLINIGNFIQHVSSYEDQEAMCHDPQGLNCSEIHAENTLGFYRMFQTLESEYFETKHNMKLIPCYRSLLKQLIKYASEPKEDEASIQYIKVHNFLHAAMLGRICSLNEITKSQMPKNPYFLDDMQSNPIFLVNKLKLEDKVQVQNKYIKKYRQNLKFTVRYLKVLITKHLTKELNQIKNKMDKKLNILLRTFSESNLESTEDLKEILDILAIFNGLKEMNHLINTTNTASLDIIQYFSNKENTKMINNGIHTIKKHISPYFKESLTKSTANARQIKETVLQQFISDWRKIIKQHSVLNFTEIMLEISSEKLNSLSYTDDDLKKLLEVQKNMKMSIQSLDEKLHKKGAAQEAIEVGKSLERKFYMAIAVPELYIKYMNDSKTIDLISNTIYLFGDQINNYENFDSHVLETIVLISTNLKNALQDIENSSMAFPEKMCEVRRGFKNLRIYLQQINQTKLYSSVQMLQESFVTLINIYDQINNLNYLSGFSQNLQHIFSEKSQKIKIEDQKLQYILNNLDLIILSDILSIQYERAVFLLKQWVFPYTKYNLGGLQDEGSPSYLDFTNSESLIQETENRIVNINTTLNRFYKGNGVGDLDEYIVLGDFASGFVSVQPFSKWEKKQNQKAIAQFLSGKEVVLKVDDPHHYNALKFKYVKLLIKAANKTLQEEIDMLLENVQLKMTHFGNSYYRCGDKNYIIANKVSVHRSTFQKSNPKQYGRYNFFLSPNALWLMKLSTHDTFHNLRKYRDSVYLTLEGSGIYLSNYDCNALNLKAFYEEWSVVPKK